MADLPDYYTQAQISEAEAASFKGGLEANRSLTPVSRDIYLATDTSKLFYCVVDGDWVDVTHACLLLAGGTMAGNIVMGGHKVTGLGAPAAQDDALRYNRLEIRNAEIAAGAAIVYSKLNLTGAIKAADIEAAAGIPLTKLEDAVCSETEAKSFVTKEFFVPAFIGDVMDYRGTKVDGAGDDAAVMLLIPQDFTALTSIEVIFSPFETAASMNFVITTWYGAYNGGEDYNVHTETEDPRNIGATVVNQNLAHSISDLVDIAALAAGDLLFVHVLYDAAVIDSNSYVLGVRLKYT